MLFSLYAARPFLMFSSITSLKMIVAPALLSALAISKPIPYDAPVTKAFLPLREHIDEIHKNSNSEKFVSYCWVKISSGILAIYSAGSPSASQEYKTYLLSGENDGCGCVTCRCSFLYPPGTIMFHQFMYFFIFTAKNVNLGIIFNFITAGIFNINRTT